MKKEIRSSLTLEEARRLLVKDTLITFNQEKWYRDVSSSSIRIKLEPFTINAINNKRKPIYDQNGIWIDTEPIIINIK